MINRKENAKMIAHLPENWSDDVIEVLSEIYKEQIEKDGKRFDAFGVIYEDELTIAVSYLNDDPATAPITYLVSMDVEPEAKAKENKVKTTAEYLKNMSDTVGIFFDSYFAAPDSLEFVSRWQDTQLGGQTLYYKISRENIALTLKAEQLLQGDQEQ